ncbi:alkylhydroperoxidase family enzyme [Altererythrobacter atlanticus]|uniref:Uncharacterized protein n=1 Tax=Croceibacterium atlanticum TaxID=1267766 RepID=A0A0F7KUQ5_9SPHN|nr:carboxymuconolactone decarboxylase family protein [Croceibacterium atlanticum]AKH42896.1 hypothetical protein WYH_01860 [Croceibacterium atlanticum]MBB5731676.1 alkylhydroperoxidase family enzyme [Croceibacterium atlanticum]
MNAKIPRLSFEELAPDLQDSLRGKFERLGYLGEFFSCTGHLPEVLTPFMEMTGKLKEALPDRWTETVALTVAVLMDNPYELHQHERLSEKLGFGKDWIAAVEQVAPDSAPLLSGEERALQRMTFGLVARQGKDTEAELDEVIDLVGKERAIAVLFLVGRYVAHAQMVNCLGLAPPVPSIFAEVMP